MAGQHSNEQTEHSEAITKRNQKEICGSKLWNSIIKNYEMIQGAQLSNSFILLMVLNEAKEPLTTTQIKKTLCSLSIRLANRYIYSRLGKIRCHIVK